MSDQDGGQLFQRAVTIAMMLLTYAGVYLTDPDEAVSLMAMDDTLSKVFPSDAALGVMMVMSWLCAAADLDGEDCKTIGQSVIDGMIAS